MTGSKPTGQLPAQRWLAPLVVMLALAVLAYGAAALWTGSEQTLGAIASIGAWAFLAGTAVASLAYVARFVRWQAMLKTLGNRIPLGINARVYLCGLALGTTPAKLGETFRSVLLLPHGVPVSHTLAAFFADRLSDVIGVAALGAAAGFFAGSRQPALEAIAGAAFVAAWGGASVLKGGRADALLAKAGAPGARPWLRAVAAPALAWSRLWSAPRSVLYALAAVVAFGIQGLVFSAYVQSAAPHVGTLQCVAIFASGTLIGAASMIPGGLGAMEAALVWQLSAQGVGWPQALAAVLLTRASTLWFGTALGVAMLISLVRPTGLARVTP